jgi:O-antigen/teichoic acid export membrane protein
VYTIAFFFGVLIVMPSRPLIKISSAYISEAWRNKDLELIRKIYIKSSINQFIIGLLLLIGIWCNIHNIFKILPPEYYEGKWVILIIGLAYLSDMMIGTSANILVNSRFYKFVTYIIVVLVVVSIFLNIVLIPLLGLIGAAIAAFISKIVTNSMFVITLQKKYKLFPFNYKHIIIAGIGLFVYFINYFLPVNENYIFDIIYRSGIITLVFVTLIYLTKVSEDLNETMKYILNYILKIRNRN